MTSNDDKLTGEYLWAEYEGARKATEIGQRAWVRQQYPDMTYGTWWGRVYRSKKAAAGYTPAAPNLFPNFIEKERVFTGDAMIVSDVHVPCTDYDFAQLVTAIADRHMRRPRRLIIAGDFYNADAYSSYRQLIKLPSWSDEIRAGEHLLHMWLETFDNIEWLMGNHDRRKLEFDDGATDVKQLLAMFCRDERVSITPLDRCFIDTDNGRWMICHGANYGINQLTVASEYAVKHQCHVIAGHEHHLAVGQDRYKRYTVVNNGGLFDPRKLAYVQTKTTRSANMARGFSMLKNGYAYVFGEAHYTDWGIWLGDDNEFVIPRQVDVRVAAA
jgi:predicted phosphodiesterase